MKQKQKSSRKEKKFSIGTNIEIQTEKDPKSKESEEWRGSRSPVLKKVMGNQDQ